MADIKKLSTDQIIEPKDPVRINISDRELNELADSIREQGIVQPIVVRPTDKENMYEIVTGHRRYLATLQARVGYIPAIVRNISDIELTELRLVENLQRENMSPFEEAVAIARYIEDFDVSQSDIAQRIGKSRQYVGNRLRLLRLREPVQEALIAGTLTPSHALVIDGAGEEDIQEYLLKWCKERDPSLRTLKHWVRDVTSIDYESDDEMQGVGHGGSGKYEPPAEYEHLCEFCMQKGIGTRYVAVRTCPHCYDLVNSLRSNEEDNMSAIERWLKYWEGVAYEE